METVRAGTLGYRAPEIWESRSVSYDRKADVWSLGCFCYTLLSGTFPFPDSAYLSGRLDSFPQVQFPERHWNGVSAAAKSFCRTCLRSNPNDRPEIFEVQGHAWLKYPQDGSDDRG